MKVSATPQLRSTVSVVTPTFNAASYLPDCLQSVANQTMAPIEHILVDGGSQDKTLQLADDAGLRILSGPDAGLYHAMSKGVTEANGDIIHILNADDVYASSTVIDDITKLMDETGCDLCHSRVVQVDEAGETIWFIGENCTKAQLLKKMRIAHPSVFVRKTVYQRFGTYGSSFQIAGDQDFLLRIWEQTTVTFLDAVTVRMRMGGASGSQPLKSYRESFAVSLIHGKPFLPALVNFGAELFKHRIVEIYRQMGGRRKRRR